MKTCSKCGMKKTLSEFYKDNTKSRDGYKASCKACNGARSVHVRKKVSTYPKTLNEAYIANIGVLERIVNKYQCFCTITIDQNKSIRLQIFGEGKPEIHEFNSEKELAMFV